MIESVHTRLITWSEQVMRGGGFGRGSGSVLGTVIDCQGVLIRSTGGDLPINIEVQETEECVNKLTDDFRNTIKEFYLNVDSTAAQKARALQCSVKTMYRRVDAAHVMIDAVLKGARLPRVS